ncbi:MAG: IS630 family transposase [Clostridiales bacterium]|jgi:transposase|nr:IS630 family transposase [Clostridiales bacterium]
MKNISVEQEVLYDSHSPKSAKRLALSALLFKEGINIETASRIIGVSGRQARNYRKTYANQGSAALTVDNRYRPVSELETYKDAIKEDLVANPAATAAEASERIYKLTGIKRSPTQIRSFMHRLGLKPLKVASIPAKADPAVQSEFLETDLDPRIKEAEDGKRALLFMDAAHFVWQLYLGVLWCVTRIFIPAASGRTRINVLGAYDPIKNELIKIINRTYVTSTTVIELLERIRAVYLDKAITIVLDNAKYQKCKAVIEKAAQLKIELLFLPTYSPNLNLIERLWRFVKKECLYSKYYKTANEFEEAITCCLNDINIGCKHKLKTLMTLKFQLFPSVKIVKTDLSDVFDIAA